MTAASTIGGAVTAIKSSLSPSASTTSKKDRPASYNARQHDKRARAAPGSAVTPTLAVNQRYLFLTGGLKTGQTICDLIDVQKIRLVDRDTVAARRSSLNLPTLSHGRRT